MFKFNFIPFVAKKKKITYKKWKKIYLNDALVKKFWFSFIALVVPQNA